ncbi:MAG TPA: tetratricopeptide repeat protein [Bacteroidia bacterium]|jgi:tetratricopeptide (TPR) repeat protein|nr:tetratricopeptide repeat protein [Bacteroidia bacterium]
MAKKIVTPKKVPGTGKKKGFVQPELRGKGFFFTNDFRIQAIIIVIIGALFYVNTYKNYYALDDDIIMKENMYVQKGFAGIGDILSNDAYKSYYESMGVDQQLAGGRYRPLSVITFAIEQQLFGKCYGQQMTDVRDSIFDYQKKGIVDQRMGDLISERNQLQKDIKQTNMKLAPLRHGFQVVYFLISMVLLLYFLRNFIFRTNTDIAFLSVLLFTIHPIHTEVIANVKSRDEIFSLIFITLTLIFFFRYDLHRKSKDMWKGVISFFLAFLSKEYAIVLLALLPMGIMVFHKRKASEVIQPMLPFLGVVFVYFILRISTVGVASAPVDMKNQDPLNDPYMFATSEQKFASEVDRLDDYLWLLCYPVTLVSDYSYQHFPYTETTDGSFWLSLMVNIGLFALMIYLFMKRHPLSFALLFYFLFFSLVNNMVFDVGATMGERLIYHSSVGFCMIVAWLFIKGLERLESAPKNVIATILVIGLCVPLWSITVKRNAEWRDDFTLFTHDVKKHPKSALCNGNAGARYMDYGLAWLGHDSIVGRDTIHNVMKDSLKVVRYADTASQYLITATKLHHKYVNGYLNLGLCHYYRGRYEEAADAWNMAYTYFPSNVNLKDYEQLFVTKANDCVRKGDFKGAARFLRDATTTMPNDPRAWSDYAGASFMAMDFVNARKAFQQAIYLDKSLQATLNNGLGASAYNERKYAAYMKDTTNLDSAFALAQGYMGTGQFYPEAHRLLDKVAAARPNDATVKHYQDSLGKLEEKLRIANLPKPKPAVKN